MFQDTIEASNITIKKCSSIFDTYFNRKFTSDCPIQHLWNCPKYNYMEIEKETNGKNAHLVFTTYFFLN